MSDSSASQARSLEILFIDDNPTNRFVTSRILGSAGHRVEPMLDGESGVAAACRKRYDAIVMDCFMPKMNGFEAARAIRSRPESLNAATPIIALTADDSEIGLDLCREAGFSERIVKPVRADAICACVEGWASRAADEESGTAALETGLPVEDSIEALPVLDLAGIRDIFGDDQEGVGALIKEFKELLEASCAELWTAIEGQSSLPDLRALSHQLKGTSRTVGAGRFGMVSAEMEKACAAGDRLRFDELLGRFRVERQALGQALEKL